MRYTLPTIQHTGTKLLAKLFKDFYWASFDEVTEEPNVLFLGHLTVNSINKIKKLDHPILVPLRHPNLVAESWRRRGKPLNELIENFNLLVNEIDPLKPHYLPIDVPDRQGYLDKINQDLNLNLTTDWSIENSKEHTYNLNYKDLPTFFEHSFINRFY